MEKYGAGSIVVSDYDPNWPALFERESTRIKHALGACSVPEGAARQFSLVR
ncbi:GrpB family protein [Bradyrhizobium sp. CNPSo 4026]|nr:GrpB family protein [Bradyrhizobium cenepequi]